MEMLNAYLKDLLILHDCVILPNFGGFVGNYQPAHKSEINYFTPPRKAIAFNPQLKENDGLLANTISQIEKVSYDTALNRIETYIASIKKELKAKGIFTIPNVGRLERIDEDKLVFTPDTSTNFLLSPVGINSFSIKSLPINMEPISAISYSELDNKPFISPLFRKVMIASVSGFALLSLLLNPGEFKNLTLSSLAPSIHKESTQITSKISESTANSVYKSTSSETIDATIYKNGNQIAEKPLAIKKYHIVVGCFSQKENAEYQAKKLAVKNIDTNIFPYNKSLTAVSAGSFETFADAKVVMDQLRKSGNAPTAWVLKRNLQ